MQCIVGYPSGLFDFPGQGTTKYIAGYPPPPPVESVIQNRALCSKLSYNLPQWSLSRTGYNVLHCRIPPSGIIDFPRQGATKYMVGYPAVEFLTIQDRIQRSTWLDTAIGISDFPGQGTMYYIVGYHLVDF